MPGYSELSLGYSEFFLAIQKYCQAIRNFFLDYSVIWVFRLELFLEWLKGLIHESRMKWLLYSKFNMRGIESSQVICHIRVDQSHGLPRVDVIFICISLEDDVLTVLESNFKFCIEFSKEKTIEF